MCRSLCSPFSLNLADGSNAAEMTLNKIKTMWYKALQFGLPYPGILAPDAGDYVRCWTTVTPDFEKHKVGVRRGLWETQPTNPASPNHPSSSARSKWRKHPAHLATRLSQHWTAISWETPRTDLLGPVSPWNVERGVNCCFKTLSLGVLVLYHVATITGVLIHWKNWNILSLLEYVPPVTSWKGYAHRVDFYLNHSFKRKHFCAQASARTYLFDFQIVVFLVCWALYYWQKRKNDFKNCFLLFLTRWKCRVMRKANAASANTDFPLKARPHRPFPRGNRAFLGGGALWLSMSPGTGLLIRPTDVTWLLNKRSQHLYLSGNDMGAPKEVLGMEQ